MVRGRLAMLVIELRLFRVRERFMSALNSHTSSPDPGKTHNYKYTNKQEHQTNKHTSQTNTHQIKKRGCDVMRCDAM